MMILGETPTGDPVSVAIDRLIGSHACIIANSGGGKSGLIRRMLEVTHGHVQHIILDVEDEFYTLRERFDYVIVGGDGGDAPATVESAPSLALATLRHGFSLIVQLNDLDPDDAPRFVGAFLDALISAPRDLWRPALVVIDEAQRFVPQGGATAATHGIKALTAQGRKRGFTAVLASQRIAKIDADVRGDVNNWLLGRVGQSLDRNTMADALGFSAREGRERLQGMADRTFWGFGPAISAEPVLMRVADVVTTPVKPGQAKVATPPAPAALREILAGLASPSGAKTAQVADATDDIRLSDYDTVDLIDELERRDPEWLKSHDEFRACVQDRDDWMAKVEQQDDGIRRAIRALRYVNIAEAEREPITIDQQPSPPTKQVSKPQISASSRAPAESGTSNASPAALAIADLLDRINPARVTWSQAATMTGRKASGGNFNSARKWLRGSGRIAEEGELIRSSAEAAAGMLRLDALELWRSVLSSPAPKMIDALLASNGLTKEQLGAAIGAQPRGGNFNNGLAQLRRNGLLYEYGSATLRLAEPLPGEAA